jgi:hypothetical protein
MDLAGKKLEVKDLKDELIRRAEKKSKMNCQENDMKYVNEQAIRWMGF